MEFLPPVRAVVSPLIFDMLQRPVGAVGLPWKVPLWTKDTGPALRDLCLRLPVGLYPIFHTLSTRTVETHVPYGTPIPRTMSEWERADPVSYTHLTLPTICSV